MEEVRRSYGIRLGIHPVGARARGLVATAVAALVLVSSVMASPAVAGGATSVLLVSPGSAEATALHHLDKRYRELELLLPDLAEAGRAEPDAGAELYDRRHINIAWMAHDEHPWRLDKIYPNSGSTGLWIQMTVDPPSTKSRWHKAESPAALLRLLKSLGLMGPLSRDATGGTHPEAVEDSSATQKELTSGAPNGESAATGKDGTHIAPVSSAGPGLTENWWWAMPGLVAGALLALLLRPLAPRLRTSTSSRMPEAMLFRRRPGEEGPRQELRDL